MAKRTKSVITTKDPLGGTMRLRLTLTSDGWYATWEDDGYPRREYQTATGHGETKSEAIQDYKRTLLRELDDAEGYHKRAMEEQRRMGL